MNERVGPYELVVLAGRGGMGAVYRARDTRDGGEVAIKSMEAGAGNIARFERETRLLRELEHPALVRYLDHGEDEDGRPFLVMEWLDGEDLDGRLARAPLTIDEALAIARRVASGLAVAHERGIVHRDVKPSNVFLVDREPAKAKLLDFGVARRKLRSEAMTRTGSVLGTVGYMSPEQAHGVEDIDARADVFALGCVLFECLTGQPAYSGPTAIAVLAKVLTGEPVPLLRSLRPEIPEPLEALVARMLASERDARPADGGELRRALDTLELPEGVLARAASAAPPRGERRIHSTILVAPLTEAERATMTPEAETEERHAVEAIAARHGASAASLIGGAFVLTIEGAGDAAERASRAAACALALASHDAETTIALATGRVETETALGAGPLIDRASALLAHARPGRVALDELSARLLEGRYEIFGSEPHAWLGPPREAGAEVRRLLGRPTPCVGRQKELALLSATWSECVEEPIARVVLITGAPGSGKTRLASELRSRVAEEAEVLRARADPVGAGSAGALARQLVRAAAGLHSGEASYARLRAHVDAIIDDAAAAARVAELLGELAGIPSTEPPSEPMCAARNDPRVMLAWTQRSFVEWLEALAKRRPLLLLIDDLHWGDRETIGYLDAALKRLANAPCLVVALARPEVHDALGSLWPSARPQELRLDALTPGAATRLARAVLGDGASAGTIERVVERAAGNAFYLEELLRAVAEGRHDALPESVLAMVQARIDALEPEARQVLLAAAVFGEVCWESGVAHVVDDPAVSAELEGWLRRLSELELLERRESSRFRGERELVFRHGLVREAAHATLSAAGRRAAHARAAAWREQAGETDARVMVEHYEEAGDLEHLRGWLTVAAEDAFAGGNLASADELAARAAREGAEGALAARCLFVRASAAGWSGRHAEQLEHAQGALALLEADLHGQESAWFMLVGGQLNTSAARGDAAAVERWLAKLLANERVLATGPCGFAYYLTMSSLGRLGRREEAKVAMRRLRAVTGAGDPAFEACRWTCEDAWERYFGYGIGRGLRAGDRAWAAFERVGDPLGQLLCKVVEAMWRGAAGQSREAVEVAERARAMAAAAGTPYMQHLADLWRGAALVAREPDEASAILSPLAGAPNAFVSLPARACLGSIELARGRLAEAHLHLAAIEAMGPGCAEVAALALRAGLARAEGDLEASLEAAERGLALAARSGAMVQSVLDLHAARLEAVRATSAEPAAAIEDARAWLADTTEGMTDDELAAFASAEARLSA